MFWAVWVHRYVVSIFDLGKGMVLSESGQGAGRVHHTIVFKPFKREVGGD